MRACLLLLLPSVAWAGMPAPVTLTDLANLRLQSISFFVALLLGAAWLVKRVWNRWSQGPGIRFRHALGLVLVVALAMQVVLAMISGARELMTPGAWAPNGVSYDRQASHLTKDEAQLNAARTRQLERLRDALWAYADTHGALPPHAFGQHVAPELWQTIDANLRFDYLPGAERGTDRLVAVEPRAFGRDRLALFADGSVDRWAQ